MEKMRNVTKKEMLEILKDDTTVENLTEGIKKQDVFKIPENKCVGFFVIKDGKNTWMTKCSKCGHITAVNVTSKVETPPYTVECDKCHSSNRFLSYGNNTTRVFTFGERSSYFASNDEKVIVVKKIEPGFFIATVFTCHIVQDYDDKAIFTEGDDNSFLLEGIRIEYIRRQSIFFTPKKGVLATREYYGAAEILMNNEHNNSYIKRFFQGTIIKTPDAVEFFESIKENPDDEFNNDSFIRSAIAYNKKLVIDAEAAKAKKTTKKCINDDIKPADLDAIKSKIRTVKNVFSVAFINEDNGNRVKYHLFCSCGCEKKGQTTKINGRIPQITCLYCENTARITTDSKDLAINHCYLYECIDENTVLARDFSYNLEYADEKLSIVDLSERVRFFFTPKTVEIFARRDRFEDSKEEWEKCRKGTCNINADGEYRYCKSSPILLNTIDEMKQIINNSFLLRTGVKQAWGLDDGSTKIEAVGLFTYDSYLSVWYNRPYIELTIKSGLIRATRDLMDNSGPEKYKGAKNIEDLFGITKTVLKIARKKDLGIGDIKCLARCYQVQSNFSVELWDEVIASGVNVNHLCEVCEDNSCSISKMMEYLQSCYDHQCIMKSEAIGIYADYSKMARDMGYNMQDKSVRWPNSLKKEHDKAMFAHKVVANELRKKAFEENCNIYRKYEYQDDTYVIIVPHKSEEVVAEGQRQRHCVATYVNSIEEGRTCICFLRMKDDIDKPYFTVEVRDGLVYQIKGYCNCYPDRFDEKLMKFIDKWAKKNSLKLDYRNH